MRLSDTTFLRPTGRLRVEVYRRHRSGLWLLDEVDDDTNLVVDLHRDIHARSLAGNAADVVGKFGVGTNGAAPAGGNTGLTGLFSKAIDSVSYPAANQVSFGFSLAAGEANGMAILEFGLLTNGGRLYARRIRGSALNKTSDVSFSGTWTISL